MVRSVAHDCATPSSFNLKRNESVCIFTAVNETLEYGTCVGRMVTGRHMCHHPSTGGDWLRRHGLRACKAGCVEMNRSEDYLQTRGNWGVGGLLLHELSHAFQDLGCAGGYCSPIVEQVCNEEAAATASPAPANAYHLLVYRVTM